MYTSSHLGLIHTWHFDAQYFDIAIIKIKRHFSTNIFFTVWIENTFFCLFETILKCNYNILKKKYLFIAISFYCNIAILCAKMSRVNKAFRVLFGVPGKCLNITKMLEIANKTSLTLQNHYLYIKDFHFTLFLADLITWWCSRFAAWFCSEPRKNANPVSRCRSWRTRGRPRWPCATRFGCGWCWRWGRWR